MKELGQIAMDVARSAGAEYADVRVVESREQYIATRNGEMESLQDADSTGLGVRTIVNGAWGFSASHRMTREAVEKTARQAVAVAKASSRVKGGALRLAGLAPVVDVWSAPCEEDSFEVSLEAKLDLLFKVDQALRRVEGITLAHAALMFSRVKKIFLNTLGSCIEQSYHQDGPPHAPSACEKHSGGGPARQVPFP